MQILFAITITSFFLLLWAAFAITRRIRASHQLERSISLQPDFSTDPLTATDGALTSDANTAQHQKLQNSAAHIGWSISSSYPHQNA